MSLDFWNNPLVVSAFRVKYRRGGISGVLILYTLVLAVGGMALQTYDRQVLSTLPWTWATKFFVVIITAQFTISTFLAVTATSRSVHAEVINRTLDFQRIAALGPRQILLGKLLGEPAQAYLLIVATVPFTTWCVFLGGATPAVAALLYVQMFTNTILWGCLGLIHRLELPGGKPGQGGSRVGLLMAGLALSAFPGLVMAGGSVFANPWAGGAAGLLTPLPTLSGLFNDNAWLYGLAFWGWEVPFLYMTPFSQLALAALIFHAMTRRLVHPMNPPLSKPHAYAVLVVADFLIAGTLFDPDRFALPLPHRVAAFCLAHFIVSLWLVICITPSRELLHSWVWRFRGRRSWLWDLWASDRTHNGLALLTFCVLGVAGLVGLVLLPAWAAGDAARRAEIHAAWPDVLVAVVGMCLLILTPGALVQATEAVLPRSRGWVFAGIFIASWALHIVGKVWKVPLLLDLSPTAHIVGWFVPAERPATSLVLLGASCVLIGLAWWWLYRWLRRTQWEVDQKLSGMGVVPKHVA